jgi:hypothetical protein
VPQDPVDISDRLQLERPAFRRARALEITPQPAASELEGIEATTRSRPAIVTLIAGYEFLRAALLMLTAAVVLRYPLRISSGAFSEIFYVVSNGAQHLTILTPLTAAYAAAIGWGLWEKEKWARRLLITTSSLALVRWLLYSWLNSRLGASDAGLARLQAAFGTAQSVTTLVAVNLLIGLYLAFSPGVAESFGD